MRQMLKVLERVAVAVGVLFTFFAAVEVLRAYTILRDVHPWMGYGFLLVLGALLGYVVYQFRALATFRTALEPPELPDEGPINVKQAKRYRLHLERVADRLAANNLLAGNGPELEALRQAVQTLPALEGDGGNVRDAVLAVERDHIGPLIAVLDKHAEAVVSDSVGIVSLGTALSPYRSVDMYIVLARNSRMINRILHVYRTRPSTRETVKVFYDVARVVAAINLINAMDNVWTGLGRHVPFLGRYGEAMSEGLFSGLLTSVAGHAAIDRSRSYRPWSKDEAVRSYRGKLGRWSGDVFSILKRHGVEKMTRKSGSTDLDPMPETDPVDDEHHNAEVTDTVSAEDSSRWWSRLGKKRPEPTPEEEND